MPENVPEDEHDDGWSSVAVEWSRLWGSAPEPMWREIVAAADIHSGVNILDVGCGAGEFLVFARALGAEASGVDPAPGMRAIAVERGLDVRDAGAENLPWPDDTFDVVTAFNALQFADDTFDALDEMKRVLKKNGRLVIANWAERALNDLDAIELALSDDEPEPDGELRVEGGLEALLEEAELTLVTAGVTKAQWTAPNADELVRAVLLGEDENVIAEYAPVVVAAAAHLKRGDGYELTNAYRWAVATRSASHRS